MKKTITSICWELFVLFCICGHMLASDIPTFPRVSDVTRVFLDTANGWSLQIMPDGSAVLQYGSTFGDYAKAPAGSLDFARFYASLAAHVSAANSDKYDIGVCILFNGQKKNESTLLCIKDKEFIRMIFSDIRAKMTPFHEGRFNVLKKGALLPDEDPIYSGTVGTRAVTPSSTPKL